MHRDVTALVRPRTVVIVGASSKRSSQGNVVIQNLQNWKFQGRILPVHPSAAEIDGLAVLNSYEALPDAVDTAIVAVPAAEVVETLRQLALAGVRSANVFSNGFSTEQEAAIWTPYGHIRTCSSALRRCLPSAAYVHESYGFDSIWSLSHNWP